ncbi:uncharacterized protein BCR38DRAFT_423609 [Pseudomassariella vexata]|uniref:Uncharacterized protein n=1 Tax=Pseudomassariella vexata TaxID=1141098 RepID=A0A1Y2EAI2_9PEZI|nr:uncharacterized protein BCR38DRAFT_423609 [Pseudomassariella vexata]ORY68552.1 hypothetical protein BCR38DRAFT_423609 [Pseudomassariella vexata]
MANDARYKACARMQLGHYRNPPHFQALDLRRGDEVLCPVYTFFATTSPMLQYGAVPILCDALEDGNFDPAKISRRAMSRTKVVIVTHL